MAVSVISALQVVGDPAQTIYSFTGATSRFLTGFRERHPEATVVKLIRVTLLAPVVLIAALVLRRAAPAGGCG